MSVEWHHVLAAEDLPEGRVTTVAAGHKSGALVHHEIRDGEAFVGVEEAPHAVAVSDLMAETMVNWGVEHVFGLDDALAEAVAHDGPAMVEVMTDPDLV